MDLLVVDLSEKREMLQFISLYVASGIKGGKSLSQAQPVGIILDGWLLLMPWFASDINAYFITM